MDKERTDALKTALPALEWAYNLAEGIELNDFGKQKRDELFKAHRKVKSVLIVEAVFTPLK